MRSTDPLTDDMIHALRDEAAAAGDWDLAHTCQRALYQSTPSLTALNPSDAQRASIREQCAEAINARREQSGEPFARVVP